MEGVRIYSGKRYLLSLEWKRVTESDSGDDETDQPRELGSEE